jgi:hypothetical protein
MRKREKIQLPLIHLKLESGQRVEILTRKKLTRLCQQDRKWVWILRKVKKQRVRLRSLIKSKGKLRILKKKIQNLFHLEKLKKENPVEKDQVDSIESLLWREKRECPA